METRKAKVLTPLMQCPDYCDEMHCPANPQAVVRFCPLLEALRTVQAYPVTKLEWVWGSTVGLVLSALWSRSVSTCNMM